MADDPEEEEFPEIEELLDEAGDFLDGQSSKAHEKKAEAALEKAKKMLASVSNAKPSRKGKKS